MPMHLHLDQAFASRPTHLQLQRTSEMPWHLEIVNIEKIRKLIAYLILAKVNHP